jgi:outer membrane protein OmpA-like peptidoglycan-associated protein
MSQSLISSLTAMFRQADARRMSEATGTPEEHILHGFRAAVASILGGLAGTAGDDGELHRVFALVRSEGGHALSAPNEFTTGLLHAEPGSALFEKGQQLLSVVFGENLSAMVEETSNQISLAPGVMAQLMSMAAPMVLSALATRVHEQGISFESFPDLLRESGDLSRWLSTPLDDSRTGPQPVAGNLRHVAAAPHNMRPARGKWMWVALIAGVLLGVVWMRGRSPSAAMVATTERAADATRARTTWPGLGRLVDRDLPGNVSLRIPGNGMEAKLISYIEDSSRSPTDERWFDFDRLTFDTNSAIPRPESEEQLANIASILKAYPQVRLRIGGYTDNKGNRQANQRLSENRAASVHRELVGMGVEPSRLEAEGYGDQHAIADNATEQGRAKNRRISLKVLQK